MNKKNLFCFAAIALTIGLFFGCSKKSAPDEFGVYKDLDSTIKVAKKSGKKILLFFVKSDDGGLNESIVNSVIHSADYAKKIGQEFETCILDFKKSRFEKDAESFDKAQNDRDMKVAVLYGASSTPALLVLSPQGFVMTSITYLPAKDVAEFSDIIEGEREKISSIEQLLLELEAAKGVDRIQKIDELYEATSTNFRYQLRALCEEVIKTDKTNESGLVGKYLLARASTKAMDCYINREGGAKAVECYLEPLKSPFLSVEEKQRSYFAAAYITGNEFPSIAVSEKIIGFLKAARDLDPSTQIAERCTLLLERQEKILLDQKETEAKKTEEETLPDE